MAREVLAVVGRAVSGSWSSESPTWFATIEFSKIPHERVVDSK